MPRTIRPLSFGNPRGALFGDERRLTALALVIAAVLLTASAAVDYLALRAVVDGRSSLHFAAELATVFAMGTPLGYLLVVALATGHAYLNRGYLPTLIAGSALRFGDAVFYPTGIRVLQEETVEFSDASVAVGFRPLFLASHPPEVLIYPSIGFAGGLFARRYLRSTRSNS